MDGRWAGCGGKEEEYTSPRGTEPHRTHAQQISVHRTQVAPRLKRP